MENSNRYFDLQNEYERENLRGFEDGMAGVLPESHGPYYLEGHAEGRNWPASIVGA
jgi:hypothetical protein